jgi:hypothetical protein
VAALAGECVQMTGQGFGDAEPRVPLDDESAVPVAAANVGRLYRQLAADLRDGTRHAPSFRDACDVHALIGQIPARDR